MRSTDEEFFLHCLGKNPSAGCFCLTFFAVVFDSDRQIGKLNGGNMDDVAPDHELLVHTFNRIRS
jgi:hypothetical protein